VADGGGGGTEEQLCGYAVGDGSSCASPDTLLVLSQAWTWPMQDRSGTSGAGEETACRRAHELISFFVQKYDISVTPELD